MRNDDVLPQLIAHRATTDPESPAITNAATGQTLTYADVHRKSVESADAFASLGVSEGDTVLVMLPTGFTSFTTWLGLAWLRAIEVPVNTAYRGSMLAHIVRDSQAKTMVVHSSFLGIVEELLDQFGSVTTLIVDGLVGSPLVASNMNVVSLQDLHPHITARHLTGPEPHDIACVVYTSGTTGPSKGVLVPWAQMHATATGLPGTEDLAPGEGFYSPFPVFHVSGKGPFYVTALANSRLVLRERFSTESFWDDIRTYSCTMTVLLGAMANFIYRQPVHEQDSDNPLRTVEMLPVIPEHKEFSRRFAVRIGTAFNMTEVSCPIVSTDWESQDATNCGRRRPGYDLKVVDAFDREVPHGTVGELVVRADEPWTLMAGYLGRPDATAEAWRNQWLHTGDGFIENIDGTFTFVDRIKDAIRRRGENISSFEVESEVNSYPAIFESAAVAVPSEHGEDEILVYVVPKDGVTVEPTDLIQFLTEKMPSFMVPRYLEVVTTLPRTPTQKIKKVELRERGISENTWDRASIDPRGAGVRTASLKS